VNYNNDFKYDLKVGQVAEKNLGELLGKKIEVKRDLQAYRTGNVYVEYHSRGKASGISTSEADYYCFVIRDNRFILILTHELKAKCRKYLGTNKDKVGGDSDTSKGILLPVKELIN
jgi:hypothetical protein